MSNTGHEALRFDAVAQLEDLRNGQDGAFHRGLLVDTPHPAWVLSKYLVLVDGIFNGGMKAPALSSE